MGKKNTPESALRAKMLEWALEVLIYVTFQLLDKILFILVHIMVM